MTRIKQNVSLKSLNTFGIDVKCKFFAEINSKKDFLDILKEIEYVQNDKLILGGGSNLLFTKDYEGLVIKNDLKGIDLVSEDEKYVVVQVAAGEVWQSFVEWAVSRKYSGVENLSLIPGCVGASPMQNIGAYGAEIKDVFVSAETLDLITGASRTFTKEECKFGYRDSIFKNELKNKVLITSVTFRLQKEASLNTSYGAINDQLREMGVAHPGVGDVSKAVILIRESKLPDPKVMGNAGSFFKNPVVDSSKYERIKKLYPNVVAYPQEDNRYKLAAGWLIEQCGLKGYELNGAAVHVKQALVIVNKNNCTGQDVLNLSQLIINKVSEKFDVQLEREVNIV